MYGLKPIGRYDGKANFAIQEFTTGATMVAGDPCYLLDGVLEMAVATGDVLGVIAEGCTDGDTDAKVIVDPGVLYLADQDNDTQTFGATTATYSPGNFFDLTGGTGVVQMDTDTGSATNGQFFAWKYNPQIEPFKSDTSICVVSIAQRQEIYPH